MLFTCLPHRRRIRRPTRVLGKPVPLRGSTPEALGLRWPTPIGPAMRVCAGPLPKVAATAKPAATKTASGRLHSSSHPRTYPNHRVSTDPLLSKRHGVTKHFGPNRQVEASIGQTKQPCHIFASIIKVFPPREITMAWNLTGVLELSVAFATDDASERCRIS